MRYDCGTIAGIRMASLPLREIIFDGSNIELFLAGRDQQPGIIAARRGRFAALFAP